MLGPMGQGCGTAWWKPTISPVTEQTADVHRCRVVEVRVEEGLIGVLRFEPTPEGIGEVRDRRRLVRHPHDASIVAMLVAETTNVDASASTLWLDSEITPLDERGRRYDAMPGPRFAKTHTPLDGVPFGPRRRYITVYRHLRSEPYFG